MFASPDDEQHGSWHLFENHHDLIEVLLSHDGHVLEVPLGHLAGEVNGRVHDGSLDQDFTEDLVVWRYV